MYEDEIKRLYVIGLLSAISKKYKKYNPYMRYDIKTASVPVGLELTIRNAILCIGYTTLPEYKNKNKLFILYAYDPMKVVHVCFTEPDMESIICSYIDNVIDKNMLCD